MARKSKRVKEMRDKVEREKLYSLEEAVEIMLGLTAVKFDETIDSAIRLGVDPRKSDQMVRGTVALPNGTGKTVRVLVFAKGEQEKEA